MSSIAPPFDIHRAHIVTSLSGGKDSTAMALWLREQGLEFEAVFMDTKWEHELTYQYLRETLEPLFGPICWLQSNKGGMVDLIRKKGMFPSRQRRFCTEELKVLPIRGHILSVIEQHPETPVVNSVGIRALESKARERLPEWELWAADGRGDVGAWIWRPLIAWTEQDVIDIHRRHGVRPNPLYMMGATRVGCWPCIHARKQEISLVAKTDPGRIVQIAALEVEVEAAARARAAVRAAKPFPDGLDDEKAAIENELRDPAGPRQARCYFQGIARNGVIYIDEVVSWSRTTRGGRQFALIDPLDNAAHDGCMRWGMCEVDQTPEQESS